MSANALALFSPSRSIRISGTAMLDIDTSHHLARPPTTTMPSSRRACQDLTLPDPPSVDRAAMEERRWRHHAVLLEHLSVLHDELHVLQCIHIVQRIPGYGDQIG